MLALDVGTSSLRTGLFDRRGRCLPGTLAQQAYPLKTDDDGRAELAPSRIAAAFEQCLAATLDAMRAQAKGRGWRLVGVGTSCFMHSLVVMRGGATLSPVITWADGRCRREAEQLRTRWDERTIHGQTGCMVRASFWPAKLAWLQRRQAGWFEGGTLWMSPGEWIHHLVCGRAVCGLSLASGTGLFDLGQLNWATDVAAAVGFDPNRMCWPLDRGDATTLPPVATRAWVARFPELDGVPWFPALGDGAASNLGCGAVRPGRAAINIGTSAAVRVVGRGRRARAPLGWFCYRIDAARYLVGGALSNAGNLRHWCLDQLKLPAAPEDLDRILRSREPHGLRVLPFWVPERSPTWNESMPGVIVGMRAATTSSDLFRATTEAVFHRLAWIAEELPGRNLDFIVSGGVLRSRSSLQLLADVMGRRILESAEREASLRGAAVFAWERLGQSVPDPACRSALEPDATHARRYRAERGSQRRLEVILSGESEALH